jgi:cyclophilin family peptidyl-prolyl cis-trans isomerase
LRHGQRVLSAELATKGFQMKRRDVVAGLAMTAASAGNATQAVAMEIPPRVILDTSMGVIELTMDPVGAPKTTAHMLRLFQSRHYVGAAIFRVEPGFLIQLGDLDADLKHRWPPGGTVELETVNNRHFRGAVALAHGEDPNSGQSSFYFDLAENASLNADPDAPPNTTGFAVFARVSQGMEVLDAIAAVERDPTRGPFPGMLPQVPIVIRAVRVVE